MADVQRFQEAISSYVLDAGESISYRSLASQVGGESASRAEALAQFYQQNGDGVGAMHVVVEQNIASTAKKTDPRARIVRLSTSSEQSSQVYGVYPSSLQGAGKDADAMEAMALALWAQERKIRNDLFTKTSRYAPLTRELRAFYESDVHCAAATSRSDLSGSQGEEAVTMFDSIKSNAHTSSARNIQMQEVSSSSSSSSSKPSLFKNTSSAATTSTSSTSTSSTSTAKSTSFFKSSSTATSAKPKAMSSIAIKSKTPVSQPDTKRIDANAMSNVFTIDSDDDEDGSGDDNAPKFVKAASTQKPRSKRVMISDDEEDDDDDDGFEQVSPPPQKATMRATTTKRKLGASPERPAKQVKQAKAVEKMQKAESPKRKRVAEKEEEEEETVEAAAEEENNQPQAEDDTLPTGPIKRRVAVTKTTINELGYMVTEKVYEDVEVSAEDLAKERAEAKKKQAAAQAAAAAQKARAAAAATKAAKSDKASTGPAKQKKLDFFFTRK